MADSDIHNQVDRLQNKSIIELPRIIDIKLHAIDNMVNNIRNLKLGDKAVVVVDDITYKIAGSKVEELLSDGGIEVQVHRVDAANLDNVDSVIETYNEMDAMFSVAVGGGTVIDVSKYSSYKNEIPFISVPTAASHDGISSARAAIKSKDTSHSMEAHAPVMVVGDVETMSQAPRRFAIAGAGDLISNRTAVLDWELSNRITGEHVSQYASLLSKLTADAIIEERTEIAKDPLKRTYTVFKGLISSSMAMCIAGSSRPSSGSEHLISHKLDQILEQPAMHGEQTGLTSIISAYLHRDNWQELLRTLEILGAPTTIDEINADEDQIIEAIVTGQDLRPERYTILKTGVNKKGARKALETTGLM